MPLSPAKYILLEALASKTKKQNAVSEGAERKEMGTEKTTVTSALLASSV